MPILEPGGEVCVGPVGGMYTDVRLLRKGIKMLLNTGVC